MNDASPAVLVLDDEPNSVNLLRITLGMDYTVYTATSGAEALDLLRDHAEIAVAIIDQRMPGMTGTEFIQRTIEPYPYLVRIILTGYTDTESLIQAINAGRVYRYLTKPWNKDELLMSVHQGMEVHGLSMENLRLQEELRRANERLHAAVRERIEGDRRIPYLCECLDQGCRGTVELTVEQFEDLRASPNRYAIVTGHPTMHGEDAVATDGDVTIVEKSD